ncbi:MAG: TolC family protein [Pseudobdellovibrionaceae bacterium]
MKFIFSTLLAVSLSLPCLAAPEASVQPSTLPNTSASQVVLNPETLRALLLKQNVSLLSQLNKVYQAKAQVNVSRGNLLPSLNIGTLISSGPSFALNTVSMLVPFLLPSKWMDLSANKYLLQAQTEAYYIAQLNTYASAYALYQTVVNDTEMRDVLQKQYDNYKQIEDYIHTAVLGGLMQESDLLQAQAQTNISRIQVSQMNELLAKETASIRQMLGLSLNQEIIFDKNHPLKLSSEYLTPEKLLSLVKMVSVEVVQIDALVAAAKAQRWSQAFSFITGGTLSESRNASTGSLGSITPIGTVNLGFGYFPALQLSSLNIQNIALQKNQLYFDQAALVETTLKSLDQATQQYQSAVLATDSLTKFYNTEVLMFKTGTTDLLHVLTAANSLTTALSGKIKAQADLDNLRINLQRMLISDNFKNIQNCQISKKMSGTKTLDEVCGGTH